MADSTHSGRRMRKRPPPALTAESGDEDSKVLRSDSSSNSSCVVVNEGDLKCPVCLQLFEDPRATICGHTFCGECLNRSLNHKKKCPSCGLALENPAEQIYPNFAVAAIAQKRRYLHKQEQRLQMDAPGSSELTADTGSVFEVINDPNLDLATVTHLMGALRKRQTELERNDSSCKVQLLSDFLDDMIGRRQQQMKRLNAELGLLNGDKTKLKAKIDVTEQTHCVVPESANTTSPTETTCNEASQRSSGSRNDVEGLSRALISGRRRMSLHFDDLEKAYLERRNPESLGDETMGTGLDDFNTVLHKMTQYESFRRLATLNYNADFNNGLSIVSSIEFDKDSEYFVVAGVTKKIKLYDYSVVLEDKVDIHYPIGEMQCNSKISCVGWSSYTKSLLASSDYDGTVQLWDAWTAQAIRKFQEHEKRCWTVHFSPVDPNLLASGSDDAKVKLWSVNAPRSIGCIDAKVNVCCVYFSPESRDQLVFGSADHCVHHYDLRSTAQPVNVFKGHKKAVSYVKFCTANEVVSASTDSHLRLWDVNNGECMRTLTGHQNEKNFVGMATDGHYIVCGSENNNVYVYYKGLSRPLISYNFTLDQQNNSPFERASRISRSDSDSNDFNSNVVVAANSQGVTQILELV